jgi:hypothetical protein
MSNNISELKVLKSAAGYYIGHTENGMPYSRESDYFRDRIDAEKAYTIMATFNKNKP